MDKAPAFNRPEFFKVAPGLTKITPIMSSKFYPEFMSIYGYMVFRCRVSAPPLAKKAAGQIEKETLKKRISNIE